MASSSSSFSSPPPHGRLVVAAVSLLIAFLAYQSFTTPLCSSLLSSSSSSSLKEPLGETKSGTPRTKIVSEEWHRAPIAALLLLILWALWASHLRGAGQPPLPDALREIVGKMDGKKYFGKAPAKPQKQPQPDRDSVAIEVAEQGAEPVFDRAVQRALQGAERGFVFVGAARHQLDADDWPRVPQHAYNPLRACDRGGRHGSCGVVPLRAAHCRECGSCKLKMEHHCFFIGNCVGHDNHKAFVLFVGYAMAGLGLASFVFGRRVLDLRAGRPCDFRGVLEEHGEEGEGREDGGGVGSSSSSSSSSALLLPFFCLVVSLGLLGALARIFIFQVGVVSTNTMSVERSTRKWREQNGASVWPYDLGWVENWRELLGRNVALWPFPTRPDTNGCCWDQDERYLEIPRRSV